MNETSTNEKPLPEEFADLDAGLKRKRISAGELIKELESLQDQTIPYGLYSKPLERAIRDMKELRRKAQESKQAPAAPEKTVKTPTQKPKHKKFWKMFLGLYCHPNKLSVADAHRCAARMARNYGISAVPTYRQAVRAVRKEDQATVEQARNK